MLNDGNVFLVGYRYNLQHALGPAWNKGDLADGIIDNGVGAMSNRNRGNFLSSIRLHDFGNTIPTSRD
jgi:hypothetical protein